MNPINHIMNAGAAPPDIRGNTAARRFPISQLNEIGQFIEDSGYEDETTLKIFEWQNEFLEVRKLRSFDNEIADLYIEKLQEILCDPMIGAPLDEEAILCNDGRTYGSLSLAVYKLLSPVEFRDRCPFDVNNETPLVGEKHPVVSYMIKWLKYHNEFLYSEELEQAYLNLLKEQGFIRELSPAEERQLQMNRVIALATASNEREAQRRDEFRSEFSREMDRTVADQIEELDNMLALIKRPSRAIPGSVIEVEERHEVEVTKIRERIADRKNEDELAFARVENNMKQAAADHLARLAESNRLLELAKQKDRDFLSKSERRIAQGFCSALEPISTKIDRDARAALSRIGNISVKDQKAVEELDRMIRLAKEKICDLEKKNNVLEVSLTYTRNKLEEVGNEQVKVQQGLDKLDHSIQEMKNRNKVNILSTVAIIGVCVFSTWALQTILTSSGSSLSGFLLPSKDGCQLGASFAL